MPKMKSHSGAKKRLKTTKSGKFKRSAAFRRHHAWAKATGQKLELRGNRYISEADQERVSRLLPNG